MVQIIKCVDGACVIIFAKPKKAKREIYVNLKINKIFSFAFCFNAIYSNYKNKHKYVRD